MPKNMSAAYEDSAETRRRLYEQTKAELVAKQIANATSYDTAVLTLSSAFLALSVTFIKEVVAPLSEASLLLVLYFSWGSYCLAIVSTVASFMVGQAGYRSLIEAAECYYIKGQIEAYQVSVTTANRIERLNILNGIFFILATVLTLVFTIANFNRLATMSTTHVPNPTTHHRGQPTVPFQQLPSPAPSPAPTAPSPTEPPPAK